MRTCATAAGGCARRMRQALFLAQPEGVRIPSEGTVRRVMERIGLVHRPKRRPNGVTKADRAARKSDDLLKRDFQADKPPEKCVTDGVYRAAAQQYGIRQSMNSDGGRWLTIPFVFFCVN